MSIPISGITVTDAIFLTMLFLKILEKEKETIKTEIPDS